MKIDDILFEKIAKRLSSGVLLKQDLLQEISRVRLDKDDSKKVIEVLKARGEIEQVNQFTFRIKPRP